MKQLFSTRTFCPEWTRVTERAGRVSRLVGWYGPVGRSFYTPRKDVFIGKV